MPPDRSVLSGFLDARDEDNEIVLRFFDLVQARVDNPDFAPGQSYWMGDDLSAEGLYRVWRYELQPYLAEYWYDNEGQLRDLNDAVSKLLTDEA
jgi:hypothetical protein